MQIPVEQHLLDSSDAHAANTQFFAKRPGRTLPRNFAEGTRNFCTLRTQPLSPRNGQLVMSFLSNGHGWGASLTSLFCLIKAISAHSGHYRAMGSRIGEGVTVVLGEKDVGRVNPYRFCQGQPQCTRPGSNSAG